MIDVIENTFDKDAIAILSDALPLRGQAFARQDVRIGQKGSYCYEVDSADTMDAVHFVRRDNGGNVSGYARLVKLTGSQLGCEIEARTLNASLGIGTSDVWQIQRVCLTGDDDKVVLRDLMAAIMKYACAHNIRDLFGFCDASGLHLLCDLGLDLSADFNGIADGTQTSFIFHAECDEPNRLALIPVALVSENHDPKPATLPAEDMKIAVNDTVRPTSKPDRSHLRLVSSQ